MNDKYKLLSDNWFKSIKTNNIKDGYIEVKTADNICKTINLKEINF